MARILVIDDEAGMRSFLYRILGRHGHHVVMAEDGRSGLAALAQSSFDLIITDLLMPGMEGVEFLFRLRAAASRIPVIAMSGGGRLGPTHYAKLARLAGAVRYLPKPFSVEELAATIEPLLGSPPAPADTPPPTDKTIPQPPAPRAGTVPSEG
jgi:DNA-binding response OmpR family regulator